MAVLSSILLLHAGTSSSNGGGGTPPTPAPSSTVTPTPTNTPSPSPTLPLNWFMWGLNSTGQLNTGRIAPVYGPYNNLPLPPYNMVEQGTAMAVVKDDNSLWVCGTGTSGTLGQNDAINRSSLVQIAGSYSKATVNIATLLALKTDGTLWSCGNGGSGQIANNSNLNRSSLVQESLGKTDWVTIASGSATMFAIDSSGRLYSAGAGTNGASGLNLTTNKSSYCQIGSGTDWSYISSSGNVALALKTDGSMYAWGTGTSGQIGNGFAINRSSPVQIGIGSTWTKVAAGSACMALRSDNTLWVWGDDSLGQLGQGDEAINRSSPVQIAGTWLDIDSAANGNTLFMIKSDNTLWGCGATSASIPTLMLQNTCSSPVMIDNRIKWENFSNNRGVNSGIMSALGRGTPVPTPTNTPTPSPTQSPTPTQAPTAQLVGFSGDANLELYGQNNGEFFIVQTPSGPIAGSTYVDVIWNPVLKEWVATTYQGNIYYSADGNTWTLAASFTPNPYATMNCCFGYTAAGTPMVAFTIQFNTGVSQTGYSLDNRNFILNPTVYNNSAYDILYANGYFIYQTGDTPQQTWRSIDGINYYQVGSITWQGSYEMVWAPELQRIVCVQTNGTNAAYTDDYGTTWTNTTMPSSQHWRGIVWTGTKFLAGNVFNGSVAQSSNGITWTTSTGMSGNSSRMTYTNGVIYSVCWNQNFLNRSTNNGTSWNTVSLSQSSLWYSIMGQNPAVTPNLATATPTPTVSASPTPSPSPSPTPSESPTATASPTPSPSPSPTPTESPTVTASPTPSNSPSPTPTPSVTLSPTPSASATNTPTPTPSPTPAPVLRGWYDYSDITNLWTNTGRTVQVTTDGDNIQGVTDDSGQGNHLASVGAAYGQLYKVNTMNGLSTGQCGWNGGNTAFEYFTGNAFQAGAFTMMCACKITTNNIAQICFAGGSYDGGNGGGRALYIDASNFFGFDSKNINYMSTQTVPLNTNVVLAATWDGSTLVLYYNGTQVLSTAAPLAASGQTRIATGGNTSGGNPWKGYVGEAKYWSGVLDSATLAAQMSALVTKWVTASATPTPTLSPSRSPSPTPSPSPSPTPSPTPSLPIQNWNIWGDNSSGQAGNNTINPFAGPTAWKTGVKYKQVSYNSSMIGYIDNNDDLFVSGANWAGQLGTNDIIDRSSPVQIAGKWAYISMGPTTVAIKFGGTLWAWGQNASSAVGDGTSINRSSPVLISASTNWVHCNSNSGSSFAVNSSGQIYHWGTNNNGCFGTNTSGNVVATPTLGVATKAWSKVFVSGFNAVGAVAQDGSLYMWGGNASGQLGINNTIDKSTPVQIGSGVDWSTVTVGQAHTVALKNTGSMFVWGSNGYGELGIGSNVAVSSPVQIAGTWLAGTAYNQLSVAIKSGGTLWTTGQQGYNYGPLPSTDLNTWTQVAGTDAYLVFGNIGDSAVGGVGSIVVP